MNKNICVLILALGVSHWAANALAATAPAANNNAFPCFKYSNQMSPGEAMPGEYKVVHSYNVNCGTTLHNLTLRAQTGMRLPMNIEKLEGGTWRIIAKGIYDPSVKYGNGQFRVVFDNKDGKSPVSYKGTFDVPL